jgi:Condensation domain
MDAETTSSIHKLIKKANDNGVVFVLENGQLLIKAKKNAVPDDRLIEDLRKNKNHIRDYFSDSGSNEQPIRNIAVGNINGEDYYQITPIQLYWLDSNIDREYKENDSIHGVGIALFRIEGVLDTTVLGESIIAFIERHESLRAAFQKINGQYVMTVKKIDSLNPLFNLREAKEGLLHNDDVGFIEFADHQFRLEEGPLFTTRILKMDGNRFVLSMKIHHVICDGWSDNIILRDLLSIYEERKNGIKANLPVLTYQVKEFMQIQNQYISTNRDEHRRYWQSLYTGLCPKMIIPGASSNQTPVKEKLSKTEHYDLPGFLFSKMGEFVSHNNVSMFIVLQATFKCFIYFYTGQNDVLIGTYILGRELSGTENLVGCFASTQVVRTVLDKTDDISSAIEKVKKANEDMLFYRAYSLRNFLEETLPQDHPMGAAFWQVNLQYTDVKESPNTGRGKEFSEMILPHGLEISRMPGKTNSLMPIDMQIEFHISASSLRLKIEYDSSRFSEKAIDALTSNYFSYIEKLEVSKSITAIGELQ